MYKIKFHKLGSSFKHYGVLGQKHGVRNYQNLDGSLTEAGREHYGVGPARDESIALYKQRREENKQKVRSGKDAYRNLSAEGQKEASEKAKVIGPKIFNDYNKSVSFKDRLKIVSNAQYGGGTYADDLQSQFFDKAMKESGGDKAVAYKASHNARVAVDPYYYSFNRLGWKPVSKNSKVGMHKTK